MKQTKSTRRSRLNKELVFSPLRLVYRHAWDNSRTVPVPPPPSTTDVSSDVSPSGLIRLELPINIVIFSYTRTDPCDNIQECKPVLKEMLRQSLEQKLYDIPYNFIVGSDGLVYEGRGWLRAPEPNRRYPETHGRSIEIAYIAHAGRTPPIAMAVAAWDLVQYLVKTNVCGHRPVYLTDYR